MFKVTQLVNGKAGKSDFEVGAFHYVIPFGRSDRILSQHSRLKSKVSKMYCWY